MNIKLSCILFILLWSAGILCSVQPGLSQASVSPHPENSAPSHPSPPSMGLDHHKAMPQERSTPIKTEQLDEAGEQFSLFLTMLADKVPPVLGDWLGQRPYGQISWLEWMSCLLLLLLLALVERLLTLSLRRWLQREIHTGTTPTWFSLFVRGAYKPLALFIWVYGLYGALTPIFVHLNSSPLTAWVHTGSKWCADIGGTGAALWFLYRLLHLLDFQIRQKAGTLRPPFSNLVQSLSRRLRSPLKVLLFLIFFRLLAPLLALGNEVQAVLGQLFGLLFIGAIAWLAGQSLTVVETVILDSYNIDVADNLQARKMHTQVRFLKRLALAIILLLAGGSMLMVFEKVRQLGTSILASAGIIGIVVGLAAQRTITNMLVGLQIALTQPIRLDDVVIVENEWGRIEEITTTYVVIKLWDLRRLVVPTTYFTDKPFQNWTRTSAELLGTVFLYVDYTLPLEVIRSKFKEILHNSPHWNGKLGQVQVTDTTATTMEIRLLVSANDAALAWDLRCAVREQMITFLQQHYPHCLPKIRAEIHPQTVPGQTRSCSVAPCTKPGQY